jgi:hypothetical protein
MPKAYVLGYESRPKLEVGTVDVEFRSRPEDAHSWEAREEAEEFCKELQSCHPIKIEIPSTNGILHVCKDFQVEEWESGKFVIFCEIPFTLGQFAVSKMKHTNQEV